MCARPAATPLTALPASSRHPAGATRSRRAALPRLQFQLLRALCDAAVAADDAHTASVGTHELVARLPFQTARPEPNHVRQVVLTLRERCAAGVPGGDLAHAAA